MAGEKCFFSLVAVNCVVIFVGIYFYVCWSLVASTLYFVASDCRLHWGSLGLVKGVSGPSGASFMGQWRASSRPFSGECLLHLEPQIL